MSRENLTPSWPDAFAIYSPETSDGRRDWPTLLTGLSLVAAALGVLASLFF